MKKHIFCLSALVLLYCNTVKAQVNDSLFKTALANYSKPIDYKHINYNSFSFLDNVIGSDVKLVGAGEATHASSEFFVTKNELFKYLVIRKGFTLLGLEVVEGDAKRINNYVVNDIGDAKGLLKQMGFWIYNTTEMLDLIEWMKNYNLTKPSESKVKFYGIDMQSCSASANELGAFFNRVDKPFVPEFEKMTKKLRNDSLYFTPTKRKDLAALKKVKTDLLFIQDKIKTNAPQYLRASSEEEITIQRHNIELCLQFINLLTAKSAFSSRDSAMCENINWILNSESKNAKMMVWAHNDHLNESLDGPEKNPVFMGGHLKLKYGSRFYSICLLFNEGSFWSIEGPKTDIGLLYKLATKQSFLKGLHKFTLEKPTRKESLTYKLNFVPQECYFVNIGTAGKEPALKPDFDKVLNFYEVGAIYRSQKTSLVDFSLMDSFDGFIFFKKVNESHLLPD